MSVEFLSHQPTVLIFLSPIYCCRNQRALHSTRIQPDPRHWFWNLVLHRHGAWLYLPPHPLSLSHPQGWISGCHGHHKGAPYSNLGVPRTPPRICDQSGSPRISPWRCLDTLANNIRAHAVFQDPLTPIAMVPVNPLRVRKFSRPPPPHIKKLCPRPCSPRNTRTYLDLNDSNQVEETDFFSI